MGDYDSALLDINRAIKLCESVEVISYLAEKAEILILQGQYELSVGVIMGINGIDVSRMAKVQIIGPLQGGQFTKMTLQDYHSYWINWIIQYFETFVGDISHVSAMGNYYLGVLLCQLGDYQKSLHYLKSSLDIDLSLRGPCDLYAEICLHLSLYNNIIDIYDLVLECQRDNPNLYYYRGVAYSKMGNQDLALTELKKAVHIDEHHIKAIQMISSVHESLDQFEEALEGYLALTKLMPDNEGVFLDAGAMYNKLARFDDTVRLLTVVIKSHPNSVLAYNNRGNAYHYLRRFKEAIADRSMAIDLNPKYAMAYFNRGNSYFESKRYDDALKDYLQAYHIDNSITGAILKIGYIYYKKEQHGEALNYLLELKGLDMHQVEYLLFRINLQMGVSIEKPANPLRLALGAFLVAESRDDLQEAIALFPLMKTTEFRILLQKMLWQSLRQPGDELERMFVWLRQLTIEQCETSAEKFEVVFEIFVKISSYEEMRFEIERFSYLANTEFIDVVRQIIIENPLWKHKAKLEQQLAWIFTAIEDIEPN